MTTVDQKEFIERVVAIPGVIGITAEDGNLSVHTEDKPTKETVEEELRALCCEEGISFENVHVTHHG